jgi:uncharacterized protein
VAARSRRIRKGVAQDLTAFVNEAPLYDVHEHHMPQFLGDRDVGLLELFQQSYAGWTQGLPSASASATDVESGAPAAGSWERVAKYVERSGSNAFVRTLVGGLVELYELSEGAITRANWEALDDEIRRHHSDPGWAGDVMRRAGVVRIITDPYLSPLMDAHETLGHTYRSVARVNALALGWHPEVRDHNGNRGHEFARALGVEIETFDDYVAFLEFFVDTLGERHQVALKNALAYDRDLHFDEPDAALARRAWGKEDPSREEQKAFGDFVVDRLCALAGERGIPFQMHLGTALVRGSYPLNAAGLIERHPGTRFLLMHLAYPWSRDLFGMAFVYRNIWLDLTWSFMLSPSHFKLALHEALEILPDESRLMLGGDCWHPEESYGALALGRRLIGEVLQEKISDGYLDEGAARRLAEKILHDNARAFFE